jgi:hypothetical protein
VKYGFINNKIIESVKMVKKCKSLSKSYFLGKRARIKPYKLRKSGAICRVWWSGNVSGAPARPAAARTGPFGQPLFSALQIGRANVLKWRQMRSFSNSGMNSGQPLGDNL